MICNHLDGYAAIGFVDGGLTPSRPATGRGTPFDIPAEGFQTRCSVDFPQGNADACSSFSSNFCPAKVMIT
jgi:hypothetical protein